MENQSSFPLKKLPQSHVFALGMLALAVLVLPLAVVAAQLTTNLSSKAYLPQLDGGPVLRSTCVGTVADISYGSDCSISTVSPTVSVTPTCTPRPRCLIGDEYPDCKLAGAPAPLPDGGWYCPPTSPTPTPSCLTTPSSITYSSSCTGRGPSYTMISFVCPDGSTQKYNPGSCMGVDALHTAANKICSSHTSCPLRTDATIQNTQVVSEKITSNIQGPSGGSLPNLNTGYLGATVKCTGGYTESIPATVCRSVTDLKAIAAKICSQHPVCPTTSITPTPSPVLQSCKSSVTRYTLQSPCRGSKATPTPTMLVGRVKCDFSKNTPCPSGMRCETTGYMGGFCVSSESPEIAIPETQTGTTSRSQTVTGLNQTYTGISFTCPDGTTQRQTAKVCTTERELVKLAEIVCQNHLVSKPTFGNKCSGSGSVSRTSVNIPQSRISGNSSIKFTCPDGYTSEYVSPSCTTQSNLLTNANRLCSTHLVCPKTTPTLTVTQTKGVVSVRYQEPKAGTGDWIGIYKPASDNTQTVDWKWLNNLQGTKPSSVSSAGTIEFKPLPAGTYEVRYIQEGNGLAGKKTPGVTVVISTVIPTPTMNQSNSAPTITTTTVTPGYIGQNYSSLVVARDSNPGDNLTMSISGLPFGVYQGPCNEQATTTSASITCSITGTPVREGSYNLTVTVKDDRGLSSNKQLIYNIYDPNRVY